MGEPMARWQAIGRVVAILWVSHWLPHWAFIQKSWQLYYSTASSSTRNNYSCHLVSFRLFPVLSHLWSQQHKMTSHDERCVNLFISNEQHDTEFFSHICQWFSLLPHFCASASPSSNPSHIYFLLIIFTHPPTPYWLTYKAVNGKSRGYPFGGEPLASPSGLHPEVLAVVLFDCQLLHPKQLLLSPCVFQTLSCTVALVKSSHKTPITSGSRTQQHMLWNALQNSEGLDEFFEKLYEWSWSHMRVRHTVGNITDPHDCIQALPGNDEYPLWHIRCWVCLSF